MKFKSLLVLVVFGTGLAALGFTAFGYAVQAPQQEQPFLNDPFHQIAASDGVIAINLGGMEEFQLVGVVECQRQVLSTYRVDRRTGEISLQSVRNMTWDLQLDEFNNGSGPPPSEFRDLLRDRQ